MAERHYLDEPYMLERVALHEIRALLGQLARTSQSPLPLRMRNTCARMHHQLAAFARELEHAAAAVQAERAREDNPTR